MQILLGALVAQGQDNFHARDDSLIVSGIESFAKLEIDNISGERDMAGTGQPVRVELNTIGLSLEAPYMAVTAKPNAAQAYFVSEAHTKGGTTLSVSSLPAARYAAKNGKKPPSADYDFSLTTAAIDYAGSDSAGDATIPEPFDSKGHVAGTRTAIEKGKLVSYAYDEIFALRGASGKLEVNPSPGAGIRTIQSAHFEGPIAFSGARTETNSETKAESTMRIERGACDHIDISTDADGETIVLEGHVRFDFDTGQGVVPVRNGNTFTIRLDPNLALVSVQGTGSPLETTVPVQTKKQ